MNIIYALLTTIIVGAIILGGLYALGFGGIISGWCSGAAMSFTAMYFMRDKKEKK
jgi:hypothetical protein